MGLSVIVHKKWISFMRCCEAASEYKSLFFSFLWTFTAHIDSSCFYRSVWTKGKFLLRRKRFRTFRRGFHFLQLSLTLPCSGRWWWVARGAPRGLTCPVLHSFYADFGPLNLAMLYRYCCKLNKKLKVSFCCCWLSLCRNVQNVSRDRCCVMQPPIHRKTEQQVHRLRPAGSAPPPDL